MRDDVTLSCHLSLAGRIHKMILVYYDYISNQHLILFEQVILLEFSSYRKFYSQLSFNYWYVGILWNEKMQPWWFLNLSWEVWYALMQKQCSWKTFMVHQTFVQWALYILFKFVKSFIRHLGLAIGNVRHVRWFSWTLQKKYFKW